MRDLDMDYHQIVTDSKRRTKFADRVKYTYSPKPMDPSGFRTFNLGTMLGDYMRVSFEGLDFDSGEVVNAEYAKVQINSKYHDGPIQSISVNTFIDCIATCGGKTLALWSQRLPGRPIFWRKQRTQYTMVTFVKTQPSFFRMTRADGKIEIWSPPTKSKSYMILLSASSKSITGSFAHLRYQSRTCFGNADSFGSFRLFTVPNDTLQSIKESTAHFDDFIDREAARKKDFLEWQKQWNANNLHLIEAKKTKEAAATKRVDDVRDDKEDKDSSKASKTVLTYIEYEKMDRERRQRENINRMITEKKRLDIPELNRQRKPLQILEEEREKKKRKQKNRIKNSDNIFQETVEMLFPEVAKHKQAPPPDPYAGGYSETEKETCYISYHTHEKTAKQTMREHPFTYVFDWKKVWSYAKERKSKSCQQLDMHRMRHNLRKEEGASYQESVVNPDALADGVEESVSEP